ncbi:MAG: GNAT family N-acetyltransferase [Bergeyella sp.]|nr:GNAT family N-acetyltransferase [Bergeyella sp.]
MIIVRKANIKDLDSLTLLFNSYRTFYGEKSNTEEVKNFVMKRLKEKDSQLYVCEDEKEVMGFMLLYLISSLTRLKELWILKNLFLSEKARGKGYAKVLIEEAKKLASQKGSCGLILETEKVNTTANNLYLKTGFKVLDQINVYEWNP